MVWTAKSAPNHQILQFWEPEPDFNYSTNYSNFYLHYYSFITVLNLKEVFFKTFHKLLVVWLAFKSNIRLLFLRQPCLRCTSVGQTMHWFANGTATSMKNAFKQRSKLTMACHHCLKAFSIDVAVPSANQCINCPNAGPTKTWLIKKKRRMFDLKASDTTNNL